MKAPSAASQYATWASARKDMVGTGLGSSRLWFTIAEGIVTEVYFPRIDIPQIKDLGFIIADDKGFWVELRKHGHYETALAEPGIPAVTLTHHHARFTFTLQVCPSQKRDVLVMRYQLTGDADLKVYALLAPRVGGAADNLACVESHNGRTVLCAEQGPFGLALAAVGADGLDVFQRCSAGCIEASDGWQDFHRHGRMTWQYDSAGPAATALIGELPAGATLALGFAGSKEAAATQAVAALLSDFSTEWDTQCAVWKSWLASETRPSLGEPLDALLLLSASVMKTHEDRTYLGAVVASLSVPWGDASQSRGGYHLVWSRDLVQTAGAFVAMGATHSARDVLRYLIATQKEDGHWYQNQWLAGTPFWEGVQLDEVAFPVLLAAMLAAKDALHAMPVRDIIARALRFIAREGPATRQDRWEEDAGLNLFTLAAAIAALVEGSVFLDATARAAALRLADAWNAQLEEWTFVADTPLARELGVRGYYVRTAPSDALTRDDAMADIIAIKNLARDCDLPASAQVSTDFLQLVRYGLRRADDPMILDSIKVADHLLKFDTQGGPVWHRYNADGYGEHDDGSAFDGAGRGRGWPLLTGERGHYALCAGEDARPFLMAMAAMSSPLGLLPEQVWDAAPIPEQGLVPGKPSGSAMPLVWAHAEFIKLCYSQVAGHPVDRPAATWARYGGVKPTLAYEIWQMGNRRRTVRAGKNLWLVLNAPARVHWGVNNWTQIRDDETKDPGLGIYEVELPLSALVAGDTVQFTFFWIETKTWEGQDFEVRVIAG